MSSTMLLPPTSTTMAATTTTIKTATLTSTTTTAAGAEMVTTIGLSSSSLSSSSKRHRADQAMRAEADSYVKTKSFYPEPCRHFKPTIEELQSTTFSEYIRKTVLRMSERGYDESDHEEGLDDSGGNDNESEETEEEAGDGDETVSDAAAASAVVVPVNQMTEENQQHDNHDAGEANTTTPESGLSVTIPPVHSHNTRHKNNIRLSIVGRVESRNKNNSKNNNLHGTQQPEKYKPDSPIVHYDYGIAKITLPKGCSTLEGIAKDQTGRGPMWQPGTELGDKKVFNHKQVVRGLGGIYEYTFFEQEPMTVSEFRTKADEYLKEQLGHRVADHEDVEVLERKFWKRLGPTMTPAFYGADMEGTLFDDDDDCLGFNVAKLRSCLQLLLMDQDDDEKQGIPGVTTPYLYYGMWASVFCAHTEDMNLLSINYLHAGAPKIWYAVPAGHDARRFEELMASSYQHAKRDCPEYLRHKRSLISPAILKKAGIPFTTAIQYPGDAIVTFPGSYHFGFNTGFNIAEATNFAVPEWIPYGRQAKVCLCRPDSVRIDINKFEQLLLQYEREARQNKRFMWAEWVARTKRKRKQEQIANASYGSSPNKVARTESTETQKRLKDFWVEVVQPAKRSASLKSKKKKNNKKSESKVTSKSKKGLKSEWDDEVWHLAKPVVRKALQPSSRVLCIIPAVITNDPTHNKRSSTNSLKRDRRGCDSSDEEDEQCFAGSVVEIHDGFVRIRLDGLTKLDDVWLEATSSKLFLDGGRWEEKETDFKMPAKHFWKIEDSKGVL